MNDLHSISLEQIHVRMRELDVLFLIPSDSEETTLALLLEYIELDEELDRRTGREV